ncbi:hypothetical protein EVAR_56786_1 [Eumeta japonica]|uniref:Uncharacterized protein n=1 Tax=Eumeta variegata TaxID=151549 RepID=A0A4C1YWX9_EUMVA|nr:hypothetical protein EVAR_56786_1 [Eumeta japonica]
MKVKTKVMAFERDESTIECDVCISKNIKCGTRADHRYSDMETYSKQNLTQQHSLFVPTGSTPPDSVQGLDRKSITDGPAAESRPAPHHAARATADPMAPRQPPLSYFAERALLYEIVVFRSVYCRDTDKICLTCPP